MKEIKWITNYNNKLQTKNFFHLDVPPKCLAGIPESEFPQKVRIITLDNSYPPKECFLHYIMRFKMENINDTVTLLSHDKTAKEFVEEKMKDKQINWQTEIVLAMYSDKSTL